ncbi:MAG TPA: inositol monophosphatase family protein [Vicinamibacterales bacterium]|nr:inositol monophosphatase family protein [Vicinamibacterales bacterium]
MDLLRRVNAIIHTAVSTVIMPSFRALRPEDIYSKDTPGDPADLVTVVDHAAERYLIAALSDVVPGAAFVGEEAVCENPALLDALAGSAPAWLIDPIDGTKNFAHGHPDFGVMIALVERGQTRASWMAVPAAQPSGYTVVAELNRGTSVNGARAERAREMPWAPRGTIHSRMMPAETARRVIDALEGKFEPRASTGSAATEYAAIIRGEKDFVIYYRLLPWDHAPGALAITEAGGAAIHLDGAPYSALSPNQVTIFAASPELAETIRRWITVTGG